jgi:HEAT repeats
MKNDPGQEPAKPWLALVRHSAGILVVAALAIIGWRACQKLANNRDGIISGQMFTGGNRGKSVITRSSPDGSSFTVDTTGASYRLEMGPPDNHSSRVFPSYAAAIRHARDHQLPTIPSTPLVLATCASIDTRLHAALELALDNHPDFGRRALIGQWLAALRDLRQRMPADLLTACDLAIAHLTTAASGDTADMNDPPLGPWATHPELATVWARDRFIARGFSVSDGRSATAAALLARTQPAAWKDQRAFARALYGEITGPSFESLATELKGMPDEELGTAEAMDRVEKEASRLAPNIGFAPAALAHASSPEQQILEPLGMTAWEDPMSTLIAAIHSGKLDLTPKADAGFYRHRWFALETLAAPRKAPEQHKLQLSTGYQQRWHRAFAAGFAEGRSGFVKRLPVMVMGSRGEGPIRMDVAPSFSAEPSPVVYLRLARAYQKLAADLAAANNPLWQSLRDNDGRPLAPQLDERVLRLHGLARIVYQEVGFSPPEAASDQEIDPNAATAAATEWLSKADQDPDLASDARLLVTLASDGAGNQRCPAVLGIRLEPVKYSWIEKPEVGDGIDARFVPARYWLASPVPALVTVSRIPAPAAFREQCDGHDTVSSVCHAFGIEEPGVFSHPLSGWLPWLRAAAGIIACVATWWLLLWWWRRPRRWLILGGGLAGGLILTTLPVAFPPSGLLKWTWIQTVKAPDGISALFTRPVVRWIGRRGTDISTSLLRESDAQSRYAGAMLWLSYYEDPLPPVATSALPMLRARLRDPIPEVAWAAWDMLMGHPAELPHLIAELTGNPDEKQLWYRLASFEETRARSPTVIDATLKLMTDDDPKVRAAAIRAVGTWKAPEPALLKQIRTAMDDPSPDVRKIAASFVKRHADAAPDR